MQAGVFSCQNRRMSRKSATATGNRNGTGGEHRRMFPRLAQKGGEPASAWNICSSFFVLSSNCCRCCNAGCGRRNRMSFWRKLLFSIPLLLATSLWVLDPTLARLLLPFRELLLVLLFAQMVICAIVIARSWAARKVYMWALAGFALVLIGVVVVQEY